MRRDSKPEIQVPRKASFAVEASNDKATGWIVRLSVVGAELESLQPPEPGSAVVVWAELIAGEGPVAMSGRVQWAWPTGFAVQFGRLGAREINAILRTARRPAA